MVTEQMKTDAQRFGNGKKGYNAKQVAEMLENAGGGYTAGTGIAISEEKAISVDTTVVALKSEIPEGFHKATSVSEIAVLSEDNKRWIFKKDTIISAIFSSQYDSYVPFIYYIKDSWIYDDNSTYEDVGFLSGNSAFYGRITKIFKDNPETLSLTRKSIIYPQQASGVISITTPTSSNINVYNPLNPNYNNQKMVIEFYVRD